MKYLTLILVSTFLISPALAVETVKVPPVPASETASDGESETVKNADKDAEQDTEKEAAAEPEKKELYNKPYVGDNIIYKAAHEDTFIDLARKHDLGFVELRAANPYLDPWMPGAGEEIILPARHLLPEVDREGIVINLPEMRLYAFLDSYAPPVTHPLGIGREGLLTPTGETSIVRKQEKPTWRPTMRMKEENPDLPDVVEPGPMNPLGTHALYLGWPTYAIHGTNRPFGIGRRVSSGCIRLYPEDIESFFKKIPVGTKVTVVDQPVKAAWIDDSLYIEAHLTMKQADVMEDAGGIPSYEVTEDDMALILDKAGEYADDLDWRMIRRVIRERNGYPVQVFTRPEPLTEKVGKADEHEKESAEKSQGQDL